MKLQLRNLQKGDDLEIAFHTHDGVLWHPAVITYIDSDVIKATSASGHPFTINRREDGYRLPRKAHG